MRPVNPATEAALVRRRRATTLEDFLARTLRLDDRADEAIAPALLETVPPDDRLAVAALFARALAALRREGAGPALVGIYWDLVREGVCGLPLPAASEG